MAKPRARRLKVFEAQFGFHDSVVAASSQQAALDAWGVRQNLFAEGSARLATDEAAIASALEHPETPLRRAAGSKDPFGLAPSLPDIPDGPKKPNGRAKPTKDPEPEEPPPPPDRSDLDAAEARLAELEAGHREEARAFERRLAELEKEADAARGRRRAEARKAKAALDEARRDYRAAGGTP
ncbi:hypothetical protein [Caulobacter hibisci]|uniref:Cell envelope biogenesis protein TolA n=1 Tax=Caulobacter hibisci TaxID=2035993 RepID=A0ABS0SUC7_9CAUL|nr:hypothetical protein [Caulobacter hibisci]MBI1683224.1 hypothetical protein [Caulobacter hibisci]